MAIFERRHYQAIAEVIHEELKEILDWGSPTRESYLSELETFTERLMKMLYRDNPNFKRERFLKACGMEEG